MQVALNSPVKRKISSESSSSTDEPKIEEEEEPVPVEKSARSQSIKIDSSYFQRSPTREESFDLDIKENAPDHQDSTPGINNTHFVINKTSRNTILVELQIFRKNIKYNISLYKFSNWSILNGKVIEIFLR